MADLRVTMTGKTLSGAITSLCGGWGQAAVWQAINYIESHTHTFYVRDTYGQRADIHVVNGPLGKYLRTDPNSSCSDNLQTLPNC